jgi:serine/threonine protein kinase
LCTLKRDLKPDNALVTEFLACKVTDFGTSRAKSDEAVAMTAVGTPLFCAPEVLNGDVYDEKVKRAAPTEVNLKPHRLTFSLSLSLSLSQN